jgi:DNA-binding transcriptional regulator YdaS (Cro superfamily)
MDSPTDPVRLAAEKAGGIVKLSLALGLSRGAASQWKRIPAERLVEVERLTGIPREILRPDLYRVQQSYTESPGSSEDRTDA